MTKRRVERELEAHEDILESLSPDERLQLYVRAVSEGKDDWMDRLVETCPRNYYRMSDPAFTTRRQNLAPLTLQAMYELHTTLLVYESLSQTHRANLIRDLDGNQPPAEEDIEAGQQRVAELAALFGDLYRQYHGFRQFADTVFGVDLETWLGIHPDGEIVLEHVTEVLETASWDERAEELVNGPETDRDDEDWTTLDDLAEQHYESWAEAWSDTVVDP